MTYNPLIPQPTDLISNSQAQLLANFGQANTIFDVDHFTFNDASVGQRGQHRKCTLVDLGGNPAAASATVPLFVKQASTGKYEIFYRQATEDGSAVIQLTGGGGSSSELPFRAYGRVNFSGTNVSVGNGPYGPGTNFNFASATKPGPNAFYSQVNFTSALADSNYFVVLQSENSAGQPVGGSFGAFNKTTTSFQFFYNGSQLAALLFFVY